MTTINVYGNDSCDCGPSQLDRIEAKLDALLALTTIQGEIVALDLSALSTEVEQNASAIDSAAVLLGTLSQQIRDLSTDPAALQALADQIDANTATLTTAVAANTPAAAPVDPAPVDPPVDPAPVDPPADPGATVI